MHTGRLTHWLSAPQIAMVATPIALEGHCMMCVEEMMPLFSCVTICSHQSSVCMISAADTEQLNNRFCYFILPRACAATFFECGLAAESHKKLLHTETRHPVTHAGSANTRPVVAFGGMHTAAASWNRVADSAAVDSTVIDVARILSGAGPIGYKSRPPLYR